MALPAWAYGAVGGATIGYFVFGDEPTELMLSAALGTKYGQSAFKRSAEFTGKQTLRGMSWIARTNVVRTAAGGVLRGSTAIAVPIAAGYATSYAIGGKSGATDFHDYITGGVSPKEWWEAVTLKSMR